MRWKKIKGESDVFVPETDDRIESKDLMDMAIEKSKTPLKKYPKEISKISDVDRREFLKDQKAFHIRQQRVNKNKYF